MTDQSFVDASVTTGPIAGSTKIYRKFAHVPGGRVPFRRVSLSNGEHLDLYRGLRASTSLWWLGTSRAVPEPRAPAGRRPRTAPR